MQSAPSQIVELDGHKLISRPTKKQRLFIDYYLDPTSDTFGNTYQSAIKSGFSDKTSRVLTANSRNTVWIQELKQLLTQYEPEHIYRAMQHIAIEGKADRDKLRALELMAKIKGLFIERSQSEVSVTFTNSVPRPGMVITPTHDEPKQGLGEPKLD